MLWDLPSKRGGAGTERKLLEGRKLREGWGRRWLGGAFFGGRKERRSWNLSLEEGVEKGEVRKKCGERGRQNSLCDTLKNLKRWKTEKGKKDQSRKKKNGGEQ